MVPTAPLRRFIAQDEERARLGFDYSNKRLTVDFAVWLGQTQRNAQRLISEMNREPYVKLWVADEFLTMLGVPFPFVYQEVREGHYVAVRWEEAVA